MNCFSIIGLRFIPGVTAPMHRVNLGQMSAKGASRSHLYSADGLHARRRLYQARVARDFSRILKEIETNKIKLQKRSIKFNLKKILNSIVSGILQKKN